MRHLSSSSAVAPASGGGVHTDTFLILAAVLCFLFCVVGLAFVARFWRLCNPSAYSVDAEPPACKNKGLKRQALPTVSFQVAGGKTDSEECAICLAEFARGDEVRVLPPCGHRFHAACVDVWLMSSSTCPSCRSALVVAAQASTDPVAGERGPCRTSTP
jgi:hypothetical protein